MSSWPADSWPDFDLPTICPQCLAHHEATSNTSSQERPQDGDVTVCIVCLGFGVYDFSRPGNLRFPTDEELAVYSADPRFEAIRAGLRIIKSRLGPLEGDYFPDQD